MGNKCKSKDEFLRRLRWSLRKLSKDEVDNALAYYEEYLEEAGEDIEETLAALGSVREIASQILADRAACDMAETPPSAKKGFSTVWLVVLGIFASPIALPLAIAFAALAMVLALAFFSLMLSLLLTVFSIIFAFFAACVGCILGGIAAICMSFFLFPHSLATGFFYLGGGLCAAGFGLLLFPGVWFVSRKLWSVLVNVFGHKLPNFVAGVLKRRVDR